MMMKMKTGCWLAVLLLFPLLLVHCCGSAATPGAEHTENNNKDDDDGATPYDFVSHNVCNIPRYSPTELVRRFGPDGVPALHRFPLIVRRSNASNVAFRQATARTAWKSNPRLGRPDFTVTLSSSNALAHHRRTIPLQDYLDESWTAAETLASQRSNTSWYLFGETYSPEWQDFLSAYELPLCSTCHPHSNTNNSTTNPTTATPFETVNHPNTNNNAHNNNTNNKYYPVALSFGIGNRGSGVQWHVHGPGFSEALHGRKHWVLYPPQHSTAQNKVSNNTSLLFFDQDQSSLQWMQQIYPTATPKPYECTLHPGDAIYFPNQWWHATINLDRYTAFISTFTTEHNYEAASDVAKQRSPSAAAADGATTSISDSRSQWRRTSTSKGSTPPENDIGWRQMESHEDETANKFDQEL